MSNLKPYRVRISETMTYEVDIAAEDEDQAETIAMETVFAMAETQRASHIVGGGGTGDYDVTEINPREVLP